MLLRKLTTFRCIYLLQRTYLVLATVFSVIVGQFPDSGKYLPPFYNFLALPVMIVPRSSGSSAPAIFENFSVFHFPFSKFKQ